MPLRANVHTRHRPAEQCTKNKNSCDSQTTWHRVYLIRVAEGQDSVRRFQPHRCSRHTQWDGCHHGGNDGHNHTGYDLPKQKWRKKMKSRQTPRTSIPLSFSKPLPISIRGIAQADRPMMTSAIGDDIMDITMQVMI